jgi:DNA-binding GntR family transcriptional regulator
MLRRPDETIDADKVREAWAQVTRQAEAAGTPVTARMIRQEVQKDEPEPQKLSCVDRALKIVLALSRRDQRKLAKLLRQEWPDVFDSVEAMAESAT